MKSGAVAENFGSEAANDKEADREPRDTDNVVSEEDSARPELSPLRKNVRQALVTVYQTGGHGSGFVIEGGLVVTAYHVAPQDQAATVVFQDGERASVVEHVTFDASKDLAVLRTDSKTKRHPLLLATSLPAIGAQVVAFRPGGGELLGTVTASGRTPSEALGCDMLQTTLNAVPGWSGGPVVNLDGEVVGVNKRLDGSNFESQGLRIATGSAAVPVTVLERLLDTASLTDASNSVARAHSDKNKPLLEAVRLDGEIQPEPDIPVHRRDRAAFYLSEGDFDKAIENYTGLIGLQPKDVEAYCSRGRAYAAKGEWEKAETDFTKAIELRPNYVDAYRGRAAVREKRSDRDGAISDYLELTRLLPKADATALVPTLVKVYKERATARGRPRL